MSWQGCDRVVVDTWTVGFVLTRLWFHGQTMYNVVTCYHNLALLYGGHIQNHVLFVGTCGQYVVLTHQSVNKHVCVWTILCMWRECNTSLLCVKIILLCTLDDSIGRHTVHIACTWEAQGTHTTWTPLGTLSAKRLVHLWPDEVYECNCVMHCVRCGLYITCVHTCTYVYGSLHVLIMRVYVYVRPCLPGLYPRYTR